MIDWVGIKSATRKLFPRILRIQPSQLRFSDESEGSVWTLDPHLEITLKDVREIGVDEERRVDVEGVDVDGVVMVCGPRMFTLMVAAESQTGDIADPRNGANLISNLKTRLGRTTSIEELSPYYAVSDWSKTTPVPYRDKEGRLINRYVIDLFCLTADNDIDGTIGAGGFINEVIGTGQVTISDGNVIPVPFDVTAED